MEIRDLRPLTAILTVMIVVDALWNPAILIGAKMTPELFQQFVTPIATGVDIAAFLFKIVTMIVFCRLILVAGNNLIAAGFEDLEFTPWSRIWWFVVPVACLFKPFQGMRELWNVSRGVYPYDTNDSLVAIWWALWLLAGVVAWVANAVTGPGTLGLWTDSVVNIVLAPVAIMLIRGIALGQTKLDGSNLNEVFA
ncbi:MAG: DUF4328 domain-containing protein [Candidatus Sphingomonas phytovorans]|nr:DUF4328 domain-containing protein [Sphingomonas sp.]WEK01650.1 MAG: DUF4328 domain-containing protein [Sphingomonas sp.]